MEEYQSLFNRVSIETLAVGVSAILDFTAIEQSEGCSEILLVIKEIFELMYVMSP